MQRIIKAVCEDLRLLKSDMQRIEVLKNRLAELNCKLITNYGLNTGGGGLPASQIERLFEKKEKLQDEIYDISTNIRAYNEAIARALTPLEREIIYVIINGGRLSEYARKKGIYKSTVYKIRDKAVIKIVRYLQERI